MIKSLALSLILTASGALAEGTVSAAGQLDHVTSEGSCSAVPIRSDLIATAAHCIVRRRIAFRPGDGQDGESYLVAKFEPHPLFETTERIDWKLRTLMHALSYHAYRYEKHKSKPATPPSGRFRAGSGPGKDHESPGRARYI